MRPVIRTMSVGGLGQSDWRREVIDLTLKTPEGDLIDYLGDGLISSLAQGHSIDFTFKASLTSAVRIDIPLFVSSAAVARVLVNGHLAATTYLPSSTESAPLLHRLSADVTDWAEESVTSVVHVRVSYKREQGITTVLNDHEQQEYGPKTIQKQNGATAWKPALFFVMAWGCVLACAILVIAHIRLLGETFRFYATLTLAGSWLASVLGLPDMAKIPLRRMIRRAYGKTRTKRRLVLVSLTLLFLFSSAAAGTVVYCLTIRYWYTRLIFSSLAETAEGEPVSVTRAFILLPWRKEAQILFEHHAYKLRTQASMSALHRYVRGFVEDSRVKNAVKKSVSSNDMGLALEDHSNPQWSSDPVVWYAGLLPEAGDDDNSVLANEAVKLLKQRGPGNAFPQAYLLRMSLDLRLQKDDRNAVRKIRTELISFIKKDEDANFLTTSEYEIACDSLAASYLRECETVTATHWFQNELNARRRTSTDEGDELLHRPPQKLLLYHMFVSYSGIEESDEEVAERILDSVDASSNCRPFRETFSKDLLQHPEYADYKNASAWLKHTILDTNLESLVSNSLQKGWRY